MGKIQDSHFENDIPVQDPKELAKKYSPGHNKFLEQLKNRVKRTKEQTQQKKAK